MGHVLLKRRIVLSVIFLISFATQLLAEGKSDTSRVAMVVAAHPEAARIGAEILRNGGNAVDAAVATAFVIGVVEPHASGLGGGGAMMIYLKDDDRVTYLDYYVEAPQHYDSTYNRSQGVVTPKAVCIPGTAAGLLEANRRYGKLTRAEVIRPALKILRDGVVINEVLKTAILEKLDVIMSFPQTEALYFDQDGFPRETGDTLRNPGLEKVLQGLIDEGEDYFYRGPFARSAEEIFKQDGGLIRYEDFGNYRVREKDVFHGKYNGYDVYAPPAPQSGVTLLEILQILNFAPGEIWQNIDSSAVATHLLIETLKRADTDRYQYLGDPAFSSIDYNGMLQPDFIRSRFEDIDLSRVRYADNFDIEPGKLGNDTPRRKPAVDDDSPHTTHISVVDADGNMVSLTQTLGLFFGSGFSAEGVLFNSSMSLFYNNDSPNKLEPGKRPISTICPTLIRKEGKPYAVVGTPGGPNILSTMSTVVTRLMDFGETPQQAVNGSRLNARINRSSIIMEGRFDKKLQNELTAMGHEIRAGADFQMYLGGVQLIWYDAENDFYVGVSDVRRDGAAVGLD